MTDMPGRNAMATTPMSRASTTTTAHCVTCCSDARGLGQCDKGTCPRDASSRKKGLGTFGCR